MEKERIAALLKMPVMDLVTEANRIRDKFAGKKIDLCTIMNAKSGFCAEDCKFCAQSSRHSTGIKAYSLKKKDEMIASAIRAKEIGADRFDIVTSGDKLSEDDFNTILDVVREVTAKIKIKMCASLGSMKEERFYLLKNAGLIRSRGYYCARLTGRRAGKTGERWPWGREEQNRKHLTGDGHLS